MHLTHTKVSPQGEGEVQAACKEASLTSFHHLIPYYLVIYEDWATTVWLAIKHVCPTVWCIRAIISHSLTYPNPA